MMKGLQLNLQAVIRLLISFCLVSVLLLCNAQNSLTSLGKPIVGDNYLFGTTAGINNPLIGQEQLKSRIGIEAGIFQELRLNKTFFLNQNLSYSLYQYNLSDQNLSVITNSVNTLLGLKILNPFLGDTKLVLGYRPNLLIGGSIRDQRGSGIAIPPQNIFSAVESSFSNGLYVGVEFRLDSKTAIEIGYNHTFNSVSQDIIQNVPNNFQVILNWNIAKDWSKGEKLILAEQTLDLLQRDTLYIINRMCETDPQDSLEILFDTYYKFSAYRILKDSEIDAVTKQPNVVHFAVIGRYYASKQDPRTNGMYLLDKNLENVDYPYLRYISYKVKDPIYYTYCFNTNRIIGTIIRKFNAQLFESSRLN